jgi:hypothetical protein
MSNNFYRSDIWVKSAQGQAIAGAQVYVCTQPANTTSVPPSPLASIFSDNLGMNPITQPIQCDGFGHVNFYALPGLYTVVVAYNNVIQNIYPDQSLGGVGTAGTGSTVFETNGVVNPVQSTLNIQGSGTVSVTADSLGNIIIAGQGGTPSYSTPGQGGFWSAGYPQTLPNGSSTTTGTVSPTPNQVTVYQFSLPFNITINRVSAYVSGGIGGSTVNVGIYSGDGNTKLLDHNFSSASNGKVTGTLGSSVTLQAGVIYYFAQTSSNGSVNMVVVAETGEYNVLESILNTNGNRIAQAANAASGGVLPATLGTLTPDSSSIPMAAVFFEP